MVMKIGIDTFASAGGRSGIGVYLIELLKRLPASEKFELFGWDYDRFVYTDIAPQCEYVSRCRFNGRTANCSATQPFRARKLCRAWF